MRAASLHPLVATDVAFYVTFAIFVVAILVLIVVTLMWVVRRDRDLRKAWRQRQGGPFGIGADTEEPPETGRS
ncbi:MAG TPA: hypothetical protein VNG12_22610 [Acidimicrobiales bacterium]|nr:hypothetical protein [Acidimicrobiales bacterium]